LLDAIERKQAHWGKRVGVNLPGYDPKNDIRSVALISQSDDCGKRQHGTPSRPVSNGYYKTQRAKHVMDIYMQSLPVYSRHAPSKLNDKSQVISFE